jgi:peptide deformylase
MALRNIRTEGDEVLTRKCREVKEMTPRLKELVNDMLETMYDAEGVGLAAPQVGVLRRIVVIDVGEGPIVLVNPVITAKDGEQTGPEGCLSVPGEWGIVDRPMTVTVKAQNRNGEWFTMTGSELKARCFCHEIDHLEGILYTDKASKMLDPDELDDED